MIFTYTSICKQQQQQQQQQQQRQRQRQLPIYSLTTFKVSLKLILLTIVTTIITDSITIITPKVVNVDSIFSTAFIATITTTPGRPSTISKSTPPAPVVPPKATPMNAAVLLSYQKARHCRHFFPSRTPSRGFLSATTERSSSTASSEETQPVTASSSSSILAKRLQGLDAPTVWQEFSPLAAQHKAVNLGQGFPDWEPPHFVIDNMMTSILPPVSSSSSSSSSTTVGRGANQYARSYAHLPLANALADIYTRRWKQSDSVASSSSYFDTIDPQTQIATATGCTNVLYCTIQGLINPGDEVILFEPAFDIYSSQVKLAGGIPKYIPLRPQIDDLTKQSASDVFVFDIDELEAAITDKTKIILINTPHNPTGKMYSQQELQNIANIVQKYPHVTVVSDEVYEHIIFDPIREPHISIATILPQQTITLSSAGKTFSATGWKVGWAIGPSHLIKAITAIQQWVNFSAATPNQDAIAYSLLQAEQTYIDPISQQSYNTYYEYLASEYLRKRTLLIHALQVAGMTPIVPPGGFFIMADTSHITFPYDEVYSTLVTDAMPLQPMPRDWALSRWLTEVVGVTAIPPSAFYSIPNIGLAQNMLRFAFCKSDMTLQEAHRRFERYFSKI